MVSEYEIVRVSKESLKDLIPLYKDAFNKAYSLEYLVKKFDTLKFGAEYIGYIAYHEKKAVACYVVFPCLMECNGQEILAAQSGDTMTHQSHRRKGLFVLLAKKTFELARQEGIKFLFGFPNDSSYQGFTKNLSWTHEDNMRLYRIKINTLPLAKLALKSSLFEPLYRFYLKGVLRSYKLTQGAFPFSTALQGSIHIKYSADYTEYKKYGGSFIFKVGGYTIWAKINGVLMIGNIEQKEGNDVLKMVKELKRLAFITGCTQITFSFTKGTYWDKNLNFLTLEEGFKVAYYDLGSALPLSKLSLSLSALDTF